MPILLGAHMSIAGGYYQAVEKAHAAGCDCVQIFTKNNNQWRAKPIAEAEVDQFSQALKKLKIKHPLSHASYLINLASPDDELREKSVAAMVVELQRAAQLSIPFVVVHPGSFTTSDESTGIANICRSINEIHRLTGGLKSNILLENTAGQGSNLGWKFEQLADMLAGVEDAGKVGVCIDTCHTFAAGYPLDPLPQYEKTMRRLARTIGLRKIKAFHLNDSKQPLGSRRDRHEHVGRGKIGLAAFRNLLNDRRWRNKPMYLETPKGEEDGCDLDEINLQVLRSLMDSA